MDGVVEWSDKVFRIFGVEAAVFTPTVEKMEAVGQLTGNLDLAQEQQADRRAAARAIRQTSDN